jgi:hypothetical protein
VTNLAGSQDQASQSQKNNCQTTGTNENCSQRQGLWDGKPNRRQSTAISDPPKDAEAEATTWSLVDMERDTIQQQRDLWHLLE